MNKQKRELSFERISNIHLKVRASPGVYKVCLSSAIINVGWVSRAGSRSPAVLSLVQRK